MQLSNDHHQIGSFSQEHDDDGGGGGCHGYLATGLQQRRPLWCLLPPSRSSSSSSPSSSTSSHPSAVAAPSSSSVSPPPALSMDLSISLPNVNPTSTINDNLLWGLSSGPMHPNPFQPLLPSSSNHSCPSPDYHPISPLVASSKGIIDINQLPSSPDCASLGEDRAEAGSTARKKLRLSRDQSALLEESFKWCNTLNPKQKNALAKKLNLKPRQVEVWFQNRRARTKLKQTEMDCALLKRCCETLAEENRNLQKEVRELRERLSVIACEGGGGDNRRNNHQNQTVIVAAANHHGSRSVPMSNNNCPLNHRMNHVPAPDPANNPITTPAADALCSLSLCPSSITRAPSALP